LWVITNSLYFLGLGVTRTSEEGNGGATKAYMTIPLGAVILVSILVEHCKKDNSRMQSEPIISVAKSVLLAIYFLQTIFIALRLDAVVSWKWSVTLLPFWFFFAIIILFTMVTLLRFIASLLDIMTGKNRDWRGIVLNFWISANLIGGLVFSAKLQVGIVQTKEGPIRINDTKELSGTVIGLLLYLTVLSLFTTVCLSCIV
jgi:hypothetical protein